VSGERWVKPSSHEPVARPMHGHLFRLAGRYSGSVPNQIATAKGIIMTTMTETEFKKVAEGHYHDCKTEAAVACDLGLYMYAGIYERGEHTNCIINVHYPWEVRIWWHLYGSLRSCLCGTWCPCVSLESIGPGREFRLCYDEFKFDCNDNYWYGAIPGEGLEPDDCSSPYKLVATVTYKTLCDYPGPILGHCELPLVNFFHADK